MSSYLLRVEGEDIPLNIVANQTWGGGMQSIIYESAGTNGGVVMVTGRTTNSMTLTGKLLATKEPTLQNLNELKNIFLSIKDAGKPVILIAPIDNNDTGVYVITEFTGSLVEGLATYLPFTMVLTEYRQANLKRTLVNLISLEPAKEFRKILEERQISIAP